ncbi:hypothetical protein C2G38_2086614, partial [Gigaspora rosea]
YRYLMVTLRLIFKSDLIFIHDILKCDFHSVMKSNFYYYDCFQKYVNDYFYIIK